MEKKLLKVFINKAVGSYCAGLLVVCRNSWWKQLGWKPDWHNSKAVTHCINCDGKGLISIANHSSFSRILVFPTRDIADQFLETFRDLIGEARVLL